MTSLESEDTIWFADEKVDSSMVAGTEGSMGPERQKWKIIVIDDDEGVLATTRLVLRGFSFENRPVELIFGQSGAEARVLVRDHPDAAILLLDVVMETGDAGLDVVRFVRDELKNTFIRIILRTGQPGYAPEEQVFVDYDINDYKEKATLSRRNIITSIIASLRSYRDLRALENTRRGLKKIIDSTADLYKPNSLKILASGILTQLASLIGYEHHGVQTQASCVAFANKKGTMRVYAGSGRFEECIGIAIENIVSQEVIDLINQSKATRKSLFFDSSYLGYFQSANGVESYVFLEGKQPFGKVEKDLIDIFSVNISFAFDKLFLNREILNTQRDVTFTLGEVIEVRSKEAGNHVRRVALYSRLLAAKSGLDQEQTELLYMASPLHDLGKIGIPDTILNKPGKLDPDERKTIEKHPLIGYEILKSSGREILEAGAIVSLQHHEKWDGSGYPGGVKGEEIHIFARITALADVFDALISHRCYRPGWDLERVLALIKEEKGRHFDPVLVDVFFDNLDDVVEIKEGLKDVSQPEE